MKTPDHIIHFWFNELSPDDWFKKSEELDMKIKNDFFDTYHQIVAGETECWRDTADGRLAEIIVLDQFARNMFRGTAKAFEADPLALILAQEAIRIGANKKIDQDKEPFLYMPFMHSESKKIHKKAIKLFERFSNYEYEVKHKEIIDRFGRYPHRNEILGRDSTPEEIEFLKNHSGF